MMKPHLCSMVCPATAAQLFLRLYISFEYNFPKASRTSLGLTPAIQFSGGNYHSEGILREKNAAH